MSRAEVTMREVLLADMYQEEINRLTAELATERRSNEKTYDHNNRLINEVDRLTAEVERLKDMYKSLEGMYVSACEAYADKKKETERLKEGGIV